MKKHTTLKSKFNSAFSLVELLVVIAVMAVIVAIAIPNITRTQQAASESSANYDEATVQRLATQANSVGATNSTGEDATVAGLRAGGVYSAVVAGETVTFRLQEPAE
jgi:prepilin-type N-terminal cleavage/methylation domain-containing protein